MTATQNTKNIVSHKAELKTVYLAVFDQFAATPDSIAEEVKGVNTKFARSLLGTLVDSNLVAISEGDEGDVWQALQTYDEVTREEAESTIDSFLDNRVTDADGAVKTKEKPAKKAKALSPCNCGCGEQTQNMYKPGHDARHAGVVGRAAAERWAVDGDPIGPDDLDELPTPALRIKAMGIADTARNKVLKKRATLAAKEAAAKVKAESSATPQAGIVDPGDDGTEQYEEGTVKVGKNEFAARRFTGSGMVEHMDDEGEWRNTSKTATKTFKS